MSLRKFELIYMYLAAITLPPQKVEIIMRNLHSTTKLGLLNKPSKMLLFFSTHQGPKIPHFHDLEEHIRALAKLHLHLWNQPAHEGGQGKQVLQL